MNRRRILVGTAALALASCISGPTHSLRYRLSIAVRAGGRVHSGSSVMSMRWGDVGGMASCNGGDRYARHPAGEAIVVEMAENGKIFGLISVPTIDAEGFQISGPERAFIPLLPPGDESKGGENSLRRLSSLTGVHPLDREH